MQNKLSDLNNHLFMQLERLGDEDLKGEALTAEIERSKALTGVSTQIISNAGLVLKASIAVREGMVGRESMRDVLGVTHEAS
jgi:hypothetical protein